MTDEPLETGQRGDRARTELLICFGQAGRSVVGQPAYVRTAAQAPGAPSHVRALGSNLTSATIVWAGPEQDGGSPLTHYAVQLQPKSAAAVANGLPLEWVVVYQVQPCFLPRADPWCTHAQGLIQTLPFGPMPSFSCPGKTFLLSAAFNTSRNLHASRSLVDRCWIACEAPASH